jgi:hypothetical protein
MMPPKKKMLPGTVHPHKAMVKVKPDHVMMEAFAE